VHLVEIINVTKLLPVLEEEIAVSANAQTTQLPQKPTPELHNLKYGSNSAIKSVLWVDSTYR
jgi:hypothetical protein